MAPIGLQLCDRIGRELRWGDVRRGLGGVSIIFQDPVSIRLRKGYSRVYRFGMMILIGVIGKGVVQCFGKNIMRK